MHEFKSLKQALKDEAKQIAKNLAWQDLSKEEKRGYLKEAKERQKTRLKALALKCVKEANEAMSKPDYVSRADSTVYVSKNITALDM